jgi:hypothetical protein
MDSPESLLWLLTDPEGRWRLRMGIEVWFLLGVVWLIFDRMLAAIKSTPK